MEKRTPALLKAKGAAPGRQSQAANKATEGLEEKAEEGHAETQRAQRKDIQEMDLGVEVGENPHS